ncbi:tyrosine-type recombinase/integrase [Streptomyces similanensis]|uniref:Tyr recombinase domain-containing protein n=1 Tax=Streptomyces similanensis TaxID=1274988 RepID=A0ABP9KSS7_9ACTN
MTAPVVSPPSLPLDVGPGPDWDYLALHGLDRAALLLRFPLGVDWHSLRSCRHPGCDRPASTAPWLCQRCLAGWRRAGAPADVDGWCVATPAPPVRRTYAERWCRVGCERTAEASGLCKSCARERLARGLTIEQYLASGVRPRPSFGPCLVRVCPRTAVMRRTQLCNPHQRQWSKAGRPERGAWALAAAAVYTAIDEVPLGDLPPTVVVQVLRGYEAQLRQGGRISPGQVKSAVRWLCDHAVKDLVDADLPPKGGTTTYLRVWQRTLPLLDADPATEHTRSLIRLSVLNPRYKGGTVDLRDVQAPWLTHLAQQYVLHLAAVGASPARLNTVGYAARWFAMFLRTLPGQGRRPGDVGRPGLHAYLRWLAQRARDTDDYRQLGDGDPARPVIAERLLPALQGKGPLLVSPQRHCQLVSTLRDILEHGRSWLAENQAADVHLLERDVPPWPERDDTDSELEGRSQDALPETVFLQLMDERHLALLPDGTRRNYIELTMRVGRRPWEIRHLEFDCLQWHDLDIEDPDGTVRRRSYPFLVYWMQKVRRRHKLPLHPSDAEVITRQQDHLRAAYPHRFTDLGRPRFERMLLFPTPRLSRANASGERPYDSSSVGYWLATWLDQADILDEHNQPLNPGRVFAYAFRHTYAQLRADAGVPLEILQVLMAHQDPSTTQVYYRVSHPRRVEAVRAIAAKFQFDLTGGRIRARSPQDDLADRIRAGAGSVPVPAGQCHEMNNIRADGRGCPVYYRCFSCAFYTTDFTHLPELRQLRAGKAEQLATLEAAYGSTLTPGPLTATNLDLLRLEIKQIDELMAKCEADIGSLTQDERRTVESWLHSKDKYLTVIPVAAVLAGRQRLQQPTLDPILLGGAPT